MSDVLVIGPYGERGTVPADQVGAVVKAGGRLANDKEIAEVRAEEAYQAQSTAKKVATVATMAGPIGYIPHLYLRSQGAVLPPGMEAYTQGVSSGFTGGLASVGMKEAVRAAGGEQAAHAYAQTAEDVKKAHGGLYNAGQIAGFLGGATASPISRAGALAESTIAPALGGLAARGVGGRAAATAASLAVRGGVEGALYGGAEQVSDDMLGDHELAADKVFMASGLGALGGAIGGAALGGAGSLVGSGLRGVKNAALEGLARVAPKAEEAAVEGAAKESTGQKLFSGKADEVARDAAYEQAWKALNSGGLSPTKYVKKVQRFLPNGERDVGEVLMRRGIINTEDGVIAAAREGKPADFIPKIGAELDKAGQDLGAIVESSGARIPMSRVAEAVSDVVRPLEAKAGFEPIAKSVFDYGESLMGKLGMPRAPEGMAAYPPEIQQQVAKSLLANHSVGVKDLLEQRKALDDLIWREGQPLNASPRVEELRTLRAKVEDIITEALDDASGKVKGELRDEYKNLKRDYFALKVAHDVASDSAARQAKNSAFGLTDKIIGTAVGTASHALGLPGFITGPAAGIASKTIRERGNAAAAVLLYRMAESGQITRAMAHIDELTGKAVKGLLAEPKKGPLPSTPAEPVGKRAQAALERVAHAQSNPEAVADRVTRATEGAATTAPMFAGALSRRFTDGLAFLAGKIPPAKTEPSPFNPTPTPRLSTEQAARLARYDEYMQRPALILEEAAQGRLTHEAVDVMKANAPRLFAEMQQRLLESMADMMARKVHIPYRQQERIGILMDIPAVASQRPDHMKLLQSNVIDSQQAANAAGPSAKPPKRPLTNKTQPSALDRIEGK